MSERLNKYIAFHLGTSRREADDLIASGQVTVNKSPAILGSRYQPGDAVAVRGKLIAEKTDYTYIMLHKPIGYVSSRRQQGDNPTIYSLLPPKYHSLKPVGRLDQDSSGVLLLTDDGDLAYRMTHPKFHKTKSYTVELDQPLEPLHQQMISDIGIQLEDGRSQLTLQSQSDDRTNWAVTMHEGRNRQIRRTFAALGYTVTKLHRTQFGTLALNDLLAGDFEVIAQP